jgi:hypothetical protein
VCVCARASVRACMRACVRVCVSRPDLTQHGNMARRGAHCRRGRGARSRAREQLAGRQLRGRGGEWWGRCGCVGDARAALVREILEEVSGGGRAGAHHWPLVVILLLGLHWHVSVVSDDYRFFFFGMITDSFFDDYRLFFWMITDSFFDVSRFLFWHVSVVADGCRFFDGVLALLAPFFLLFGALIGTLLIVFNRRDFR